MKYGTDYSKTAINLNNPSEVRNLLIEWDKAQELFEATDAALTERTKEVPDAD